MIIQISISLISVILSLSNIFSIFFFILLSRWSISIRERRSRSSKHLPVALLLLASPRCVLLECRQSWWSDWRFLTLSYKDASIELSSPICTLPLDTAKVKLQLQKKGAVGDGVAMLRYRGILGTITTIIREEGLSSLWKGVIPGLHRQCLYGGLRIGLYDFVKNVLFLNDFVRDVPLLNEVLSALLTGALAIIVANPTDLVKVQLQAEGRFPPGAPRQYAGALDAYCTIARQEGVRGLWKGLGPNIARNAIINAVELASYDQVKQKILQIPGFTDGIFTHLMAGLAAGFFAVCVGSPLDVVKSRMMGDASYRSALECFFVTLRNEGPFAFFKGFIPNFIRLGLWNVIMFLTLEQAKSFFRNQ